MIYIPSVQHYFVALLLLTLVFGCEDSSDLPPATNEGLPNTPEPVPFPPDPPPEPIERTLQSYKIFGTLPINNLVMNPLLETVTTTLEPILLNRQRPTRLVTTWSPTQTPIIRINEPTGVLIVFQSQYAPLDISVWIGFSDGLDFTRTEVAVFGIRRQSSPLVETQSLIAEEKEDKIMGDIIWRRYQGQLSTFLLGHGWLLISSLASRMHITGPVVVLANKIEVAHSPPHRQTSTAKVISEADYNRASKVILEWQQAIPWYLD
ncbi:MAG: hypothetical protein KTR25_01680 [Myxococcales bacterium]|nr:hypothetical protein [Myxococcales bacterium]